MPDLKEERLQYLLRLLGIAFIRYGVCFCDGGQVPPETTDQTGCQNRSIQTWLNHTFSEIYLVVQPCLVPYAGHLPFASA